MVIGTSTLYPRRSGHANSVRNGQSLDRTRDSIAFRFVLILFEGRLMILLGLLTSWQTAKNFAWICCNITRSEGGRLLFVPKVSLTERRRYEYIYIYIYME